MSTARTLVGTMRVPFLLLPPVCVALGLASAAWAGGPVDVGRAMLVLLGAVGAHVSVNMFNEWHDCRTGLDARTQRTPFSGGSGSLQAHPEALSATLLGASAALLLTVAIGLWLMTHQGAALLPIGLVGALLVVAYTPWITHRPLLCLLAPGLGFGTLMVVGTDVAVSGAHHRATYVASLVPLLLVSGLLFLNQFPDVEADRAVGRRHIPMLWGRPRAARLFAMLALGPQAVVLVAVALRVLPPQALLMLLALPLAVVVVRGALRDADDLPALVPTMGRNVALTLVTPLLLAVGLWWAAW
jgi:1,4-dihydroxy-2-naphthoate octaprenyltransferase